MTKIPGSGSASGSGSISQRQRSERPHFFAVVITVARIGWLWHHPIHRERSDLERGKEGEHFCIGVLGVNWAKERKFVFLSK
jgi:hypothetical protein